MIKLSDKTSYNNKKLKHKGGGKNASCKNKK